MLTARIRTTQQKQAIKGTFTTVERPLTVQEVLAMAQDQCPGLGVATVYRAVNRLVQSGWLKEVHLPSQPIRYERQDLAHHHHFHCQTCERVLDIAAPCEALAALIPEGFEVHRHDLTFYGVCGECTPLTP